VFVGLLYAVGALLSAAKFRAAGLSIRDTLPLLPLETILATGIGTLIASALLVCAWIGLGIGVGLAARRLRDGAAERAALIAGLCLLGVALVLLLTPVLIVTFAAIATIVYLGLRGGRSIALVFTVSFGIAIAGLVIGAFVYPAPLPVAHVTADRDTAPLTGDFVAQDGGVWYVADFDTDEVRGFNLLNVDAASFRSRDRDPRPTLLGVFD
jgi:hypothetical protein